MADLIDRQAAIKTVLTYLVEYCGAAFDEDMQRTLKERLDPLPSAEPERKTGKWNAEFNGAFRGGAYWFSCSRCKRVVPEVRNGGWNFCPNCGADMRGEQDENNRNDNNNHNGY